MWVLGVGRGLAVGRFLGRIDDMGRGGRESRRDRALLPPFHNFLVCVYILYTPPLE